MKQLRTKRSHWLWWLLGTPVDFYQLLEGQAAKTLEGIEALDSWIRAGAESRCQDVRDLENEADQLKLDLQRKLVDSFVTPFDREDIYDLSVRMDEIINTAKSAVREIEALDVSSDEMMREMSQVLVEGTGELVQAFKLLKTDPRAAAEHATVARKSDNRIFKIYRQAMRQLFTVEDAKQILKTREVYRRLLDAGERLDAVGEKFLHVIVKIS